MRLSEAIRLGATMRPQIFGTTFDGTGTCTWGAAYDGVGMLHRMMNGGSFPDLIFAQQWGYAMNSQARHHCPHCNALYYTIHEFIIHLNDKEKWTREKIADWVELEEIAFLGKETAPEEFPDPIPAPEEEPVKVA